MVTNRGSVSKSLPLLLLLALFLTGCSQNLIMTDDTYTQVEIGMTEQEIERLAGRPFEIRESQEYQGKELVYIERREYERGFPVQMHYIFQLDEEGRVFDKKRRFLEQDPLEIEWRID